MKFLSETKKREYQTIRVLISKPVNGYFFIYQSAFTQNAACLSIICAWIIEMEKNRGV